MKDDVRRELATPFAVLTQYETDHLVTHLVLAEQPAAIRRLLSMQVDGVHAWSAHKRAQEREAGLVADLELARDQAIGTGQPGLAIRYALIRASLAAAANKTPAELIVAGARYGSLTLDQAINQAADRVDPLGRARLFAALSEVAVRQKATAAAETASLNALTAVEQIDLSYYGLAIFSDIVTSLALSAIAPAAQMVRRAKPALAGRALLQLAMTQDRSDPAWRQLFEEALTLARQETNPLYRSLLLAELGSASEGNQRRILCAEALETADEEADQVYRARLLGQLASHLAEDQIQSLWERVRDFPAWTLDHGRWQVRQEAVLGIAPAAAGVGLHELAIEAAAALEDTADYPEARLAVIEAAGSLPEPLAGLLLTQLAEAIESRLRRLQLRKPTIPRLFRLVASRSIARITAREILASYAAKKSDLWLPTGTRHGWDISERVVAAAAIRSLPASRRDEVLQLLDSDPETRALITDVGFLIEADLCKKALAVADSASYEARLKLAATVDGTDRQRLIEPVLAAIGTGDPNADALLAVRAADLLPPNAAITLLRRAHKQVERLSDTEVVEEMIGALHQPPTIPDFTTGTPITPVRCQDDAKLSAAIAKAIELSDLEPGYDEYPPRQARLDILMPKALQNGMFEAYATAADAYPIRFGSWELAGFLGHLFKAGAYQTAFKAFERLGGWSAWSELAEAAEHLPDDLFGQWMNCVLRLQPPKRRAEPIVAAGRRLLPADVFEQALRCSCELIDTEARQTALIGIVSNWRYYAQHQQPAKRQQYLQMLLRSGSRMGRSQLVRDLSSTAAALRDVLTAEDLDEISGAAADVQHWWP